MPAMESNASPTPRPPITSFQIIGLIRDTNPDSLLTTLKRLKSIIAESEHNRRCVESSGAIEFLSSVVRKHFKDKLVVDEALNVLHSLQMSDKALDELLQKNPDFLDTLTSVLEGLGFQTRAYATMLLRSIIDRVQQVKGVKEGLMVEVVEDRISNQTMKVSLHVLNIVIPHGRNRVKAVEEGAVEVVIELMMEEKESRMTDMALVLLARLSECAKGREKIAGHGVGIAILSKKMVRVSMVATERAIMVMYNLGKCWAMRQVWKEMLEFRVVGKLCLLVQVDCGVKSKETVKELLAMHSRVWRDSPCVAPALNASYSHDL